MRTQVEIETAGSKRQSDSTTKKSEVRTGERSCGFTSYERRTMDKRELIEGWGADLDSRNRPGVPMDKSPFAGIETLYPDIEPQLSRVEILQSTEHRKRPPVFGTTCPPKKVSGMLRRAAFKASEGRKKHWLALLLADRVDMIEELASDLAHGQIPNFFVEMGLSAEWKYNRENFLKNTALAGGALAVVVAAGVVWSKRTTARRIR